MLTNFGKSTEIGIMPATWKAECLRDSKKSKRSFDFNGYILLIIIERLSYCKSLFDIKILRIFSDIVEWLSGRFLCYINILRYRDICSMTNSAKDSSLFYDKNTINWNKCWKFFTIKISLKLLYKFLLTLSYQMLLRKIKKLSVLIKLIYQCDKATINCWYVVNTFVSVNYQKVLFIWWYISIFLSTILLLCNQNLFLIYFSSYTEYSLHTIASIVTRIYLCVWRFRS